MCFASLNKSWVLPHRALKPKARPGLGFGAKVLYKVEILKIFHLRGKGELQQIFPLTSEQFSILYMFRGIL